MTRSLSIGVAAIGWLAWNGVSAAADSPAGEPLAEVALRQRVHQLREELRDVPLPLIIEEFSGHRVLPWRGEERARLDAVASGVLTAINDGNLTAARANEAGNDVEDIVLATLVADGFEARRPAGPSGHVRAAGYPDLEARIDASGPAFYVEVKTYRAATADSTQRTFYLSPSEDFKVTQDAIHLLIAVQLEQEAGGRYRAVQVRWLDLSRLRCDLKPEFNASNRDLYGSAAGLIVIERGAASPRPAAE